MKHLTEEELIELYCGNGVEDGEGNPAVTRHLEVCSACLASYAALRSDLGEAANLQVPARDGAYGERVWQSIRASLPIYESRPKAWSGLRLWSTLGYAAACALLVVGAFTAGRIWEHRQQPGVAVAKQPPAPQARQPIVVVVLSDHLDRSERFLVQLKHADVESNEMVSPLRDEAKSLLAANRVCRKNVAPADDPALTTALDHLDRLLAEAANAPGGLNATALANLQDEMNADGLLFEVRVLRSRISHHSAAGNDHPKGGTI